MESQTKQISRSSEDTQRFFAKFAQSLNAGDVVGFCGELGAGKTTAIQAILSYFGVLGGESPTFVIVRPYTPEKPRHKISSIIHIDAYRLSGPKDALSVGLQDHLAEPSSLVLVEWADKVAALLPAQAIWVKLSHRGGDMREITVRRP